MLASVGFTPDMQQQPVASLSGGWKMKLALARAMLMKAVIMLLDEPTNHLDVTNVAWLVNYLTHLPQVTSMVVSHDSGFLDNVCSHIIHYENRKLKTYRVRAHTPPTTTFGLLHWRVTIHSQRHIRSGRLPLAACMVHANLAHDPAAVWRRSLILVVHACLIGMRPLVA